MFFSYTASGTGVQSFASPVTGRIKGVAVSANQAGTAHISLTGVQTPSSGVVGNDGALIAAIGQTGVMILTDFQIDAGQLIFIDVKAAGTFSFYVT